MNRGILATCYARPTGAAAEVTTADLVALLHETYDDEPFVVVSDGSPSTKATLGSNSVHVTALADERTGWVVALAALDNLVKGASGQAVQCANLALGLDETAGLPVVGHLAVTRHRPPGVRRRRRGTAASSRPATPTSRSSPPPTAPPVAAAGVFTQNLVVAAPVHGQPAPPGQRPAGGRPPSCSTAATPTPPPGPTGEADAERMCALAAEAVGAATDEVLVCSTGLIGIPLPMDAARGRHPRRRRGPGRPAGGGTPPPRRS